MNPHVFGAYTVYPDQTYFLAYAGGKRDLLIADQKNYERALGLPLLAQIEELRRLGNEKNPNVVPIKGSELITLIRDRELVPMFDKFFEYTHLLQVNSLIIYESIKAKSYDMALRG